MGGFNKLSIFFDSCSYYISLSALIPSSKGIKEGMRRLGSSGVGKVLGILIQNFCSMLKFSAKLSALVCFQESSFAECQLCFVLLLFMSMFPTYYTWFLSHQIPLQRNSVQISCEELCFENIAFKL